MQSHLYCLKWGKLLLVRPCILSPASNQTLQSALRKPSCHSTRSIQQRRPGSTAAGHKLESSKGQYGQQCNLEEEAEEGMQPDAHHKPEESSASRPPLVHWASTWQQSISADSKKKAHEDIQSEVYHKPAESSTSRPLLTHLAPTWQQNISPDTKEEAHEETQSEVYHKPAESSTSRPSLIHWAPTWQQKISPDSREGHVHQTTELSKPTKRQTSNCAADKSYVQKTMVQGPPAEQRYLDRFPEEHDGNVAMALAESMESRSIDQIPAKSNVQETIVSWKPFTPWKIPIPKPHKTLLESQRTRRNLPSPLTVLGEYLDCQDASQRIDKYAKLISHLDPCRLPSIFLYYLHRTYGQGFAWSVVDNENQFLRAARDHLDKKGYTEADLAHWHWILSGDSTTAVVDRFFHTSSPKPLFLLSQILRRDGLHVASFHKILDHVKIIDMIAEAQNSDDDTLQSTSQSIIGVKMELNEFEVLISRLLSQARRVWPAAMVDIIGMAEPHFNSAMKKELSKAETNLKISRLSSLLNYLIRLLSLPAKANPLASVRHNWQAQKIMLELAGKFDPPLTLSMASYRSIVRVLAATPKSFIESKSATLRTRTWPPWRRDEDGMDAKRLLEEDYSRVIQAMFKAQEAGYRLDDQDIAAGIFGGLEHDGTPTIQTRRSLRKPRDTASEGSMSSQIWAARIEATRDVQEAWIAFLQFREEGGTPKQDMFLAMFTKLNYDSLLMRNSKHTAPPGDGKEVLAVSNENYTKYYIERLHAPKLPMLYKEMLGMGIRPSGRCLMFLIGKARTTDEGLKYLLDGGYDKKAIRLLAEGASSLVDAAELSKIPNAVLYAYINLSCRLAARAVKEYSDWRSLSEDESDLAPRFTFLTDDSGEAEGSENWTIVDQRPTTDRHHYTRESYNHIFFLIKASSTTFRPVWYAYFRALAREGAVIAREVVGNPKQDSLAWLRIRSCLKDFESRGLELEPEGFHHICVGFEKFAGGNLGNLTTRYRFRAVPREERWVLRDAFAKLSETQQRSKNLPALFHTIRGVHLHAYVRALGAVEDHEGIMSAFEWMVENNEELEAISSENRNGLVGFQRTLIATRYHLEGSSYGEQARELASKVVWWGDWPSDEAVVSYMRGAHYVEEVEEVVEDPTGADWE